MKRKTLIASSIATSLFVTSAVFAEENNSFYKVFIMIEEGFLTAKRAWTDWYNDGAEVCDGWTPDPSNYILGEKFTQTQNCNQPQKRDKDGEASETRIVSREETQEGIGTSVWTQVGVPFNCTAWLPLTSEYALGDSFTQSRDCDQNMERRNGLDTDVIQITESQAAIGTTDWSSWVNVGSPKNCTNWLPSPSDYALGASFTQTGDCKQDQERTRLAGEKETRTTDTQDTRSATGTTDWSSWSNVGSPKDCVNWSPDTSDYALGVSFTQTGDCKQEQERTRLAGERETKEIDVTDTRSATGTTDWSSWRNVGSPKDCVNWSPDVNTQIKGVSFTQTGDCKQGQERTRLAGEKETRNIDVTDTRSAVGTLDWSAWVNVGSVQNCSAWSPGTSSYALGVTFTQSRNCEQPQKRTRGVEEETRNNPVTETRQATGTTDWSAWTNVGGVKNCSVWTPDVGEKPLGESFTQTRECDQDQQRTRLVGETETKTIKVSLTQSATGTRFTFEEVLIGYYNSIARDSKGRVYTAGYGASYGLGLGDTSERSTFTYTGRTDAAMVATGIFASYYVSTSGNLYSVGANSNGQLGIGNFTNQSTWQTVPKPSGVSKFTAVYAGHNHFYAVDQSGNVWSAGANDRGQLGLGKTKAELAKSSTLQKTNLSNVTDIQIGQQYSLALTSSKEVYGVGRNDYGHLGIGNNSDATSWQKAPNLSNIKAISANQFASSYALDTSGKMWATGDLDYGMSGRTGETDARYLSWTEMNNISNVKDMVLTSTNSSAVLLSNGELKVLGRNNVNQTGIMSSTATITNWVTLDTGVKEILSTAAYRKEDGKIYVAGYQLFGKFGVGVSGGSSMGPTQLAIPNP